MRGRPEGQREYDDCEIERDRPEQEGVSRCPLAGLVQDDSHRGSVEDLALGGK